MTKRHCYSSSSKALLPIRALSKICSYPIEFSINDPPSDKPVSIELIIETQNPFTKQNHTICYAGMLSCVRTISKSLPELGLWDDKNESKIESWINFGVNELFWVYSPLEEEKKQVRVNTTQNVSESIEQYLFKSSQTFLVGESVTAADIVVAFLLCEAMNAVGLDSVPQQTYRWMCTILKNDSVIGGDALKLPTEGKKSPDSKPTAVVSEKKEEPKKKQKAKKQEPKREEKAVKSEEKVVETSVELADAGENAILSKLASLSIPHSTYSHTLCMTAEELVTNVPLPSPSHSHTKNLFLKDKKHGMFLVTVCTSTAVNTKELGKLLKLEGKSNLRLADEATLWDTLGVKPGCVGPLSILNDVEKKVTLVLDEDLLKKEKIHSHPLYNTQSTVLEAKDLMAYVKACDHEPIVLSFGSSSSEKKKDDEKWEGKAASSRPPESKEKKKPDKAVKQQQSQAQDKKSTKKGETQLKLHWTKSENFAMWYSDLIVLSEMISYYDISGCYILRPWSYKIWQEIQQWFDEQLISLQVDNAYFPLFVSLDRLEKEKDHVEGFAPEVAWVTKSGEDTLSKPIAIRPTSETIMYPAFADWIMSHRDLPLKLNQWSNVVRWEFKDPTPFLRSREFLWQEGHTAHATFEEAETMVMQALELYRAVYEDLLCVPVIKGYKTEKEKFAGGYRTTTVEAYIPGSGRAIQGATSHHLGQNFGKMFDITFQDINGKKEVVWQTSWGLTTRTIGVMVMVHGDDVGLVLPPKIAPIQVVIIPIVSKNLTMEDVTPYCLRIFHMLQNVRIRTKFDDRSLYNPGWKYNHWEQKGVPIRIEIGPRDVQQTQVRVVIRHSGEKFDLPLHETTLPQALLHQLSAIHNQMFAKVKNIRDSHVIKVTEWKNFVPELEKNNLVLTPWCGGEFQQWEDWVKNTSREESLKLRNQGDEDVRAATSVAAKTLCIPFDQPQLHDGMKCIASGLPAKCWVLWGRSY